MKKYLSGLVALVFAVGFTAFTTRTVDPLMKYVGPNFTQTEVENPQNWQEVTSFTCGTAGTKACLLNIPASYLDASSPRKIDPTQLSIVPTIDPTSSGNYKADLVSPVSAVDDKF